MVRRRAARKKITAKKENHQQRVVRVRKKRAHFEIGMPCSGTAFVCIRRVPSSGGLMGARSASIFSLALINVSVIGVLDFYSSFLMNRCLCGCDCVCIGSLRVKLSLSMSERESVEKK